MKIEFKQVGRDKLSWETELTKVTRSALIKSIKTKRALASKLIDFAPASACGQDETQTYSIFAGDRHAGSVVIHSYHVLEI